MIKNISLKSVIKNILFDLLALCSIVIVFFGESSATKGFSCPDTPPLIFWDAAILMIIVHISYSKGYFITKTALFSIILFFAFNAYFEASKIELVILFSIFSLLTLFSVLKKTNFLLYNAPLMLSIIGKTLSSLPRDDGIQIRCNGSVNNYSLYYITNIIYCILYIIIVLFIFIRKTPISYKETEKTSEPE